MTGRNTMDIASQDDRWQAPVDLTVREAAALFDVSARTLAQHLRCGRLAGYKTRGAAGQEWRVTAGAMDVAGYRRRDDPVPAALGSDDTEVLRLRQEVTIARRAAAADRRRADDLDRRLGHALLECGRLRRALASSSGDQPPAEPNLAPATARWLMAEITNGATLARTTQRPSPD